MCKRADAEFRTFVCPDWNRNSEEIHHSCRCQTTQLQRKMEWMSFHYVQKSLCALDVAAFLIHLSSHFRTLAVWMLW